MAGKGPPPKPTRARRNGGGVDVRIITSEPVEQPDLPEFDVQVEIDGDFTYQSFEWPERTHAWWKVWADSPLSADFTSTDWSNLMDTARIHAAYWQGDLKLAAELRLREAKFGATPEDRARLKIQFAAADEAEDRKERRRSGVAKPTGEDPRLKLMG